MTTIQQTAFCLIATASALAADAATPSFVVEGDRANRTYFIQWDEGADNATSSLERVTYTFPDADAGRGDGLFSITTTNRLFHRRFPAGAPAPFTVRADVRLNDGTAFATNLPVAFNPSPLQKPFPNSKILVGTTGYGAAAERWEMATNRLGNLVVGWTGFGRFLPEDPVCGTNWIEQVKANDMYVMTIYGNQKPPDVARLREVWGPRYLGNNVGEYAGYLYQDAKCNYGPQDMDVVASREWFLGKFIHGRCRGRRVLPETQCEPYLFSTSGSPLACYELQGGFDYICNELYAVGSGNLAYATSEARGAARRWQPEWWSAWLAHEWQTCWHGLPYLCDQKYLSLEAGLKELYVMGTSMMVLESGTSGTQAHDYTPNEPGGAKGVKHGFDDEVPVRYRATMRKFYEWLLAHPRAEGTPDTSIALALGHGDSYVGMTFDIFAAWGQHKRAETDPNWKDGPAEHSWNALQNTFFPRPADCLKPFANAWLGGQPYGQVDVVSVDDEIRLADLARYKLLVFGGFNLMTERAKAVLVRWMEQGGTLVMCLPQLLTTADREVTHYAASSLLPAFPGLVVGQDPVAVEGVPTTSAAAPTGLVAAASAPLKLRVADTTFDKDTEVLVSVADKPLLLRRNLGKGSFHLFTAWEFPGEGNAYSKLWTTLAGELASQIPQRVTIAPAGGRDDRPYICFAAYDTQAYFLNTDCMVPRTVEAHLPDGTTRTLVIPPCELETLTIPPRGDGARPGWR